MRIKRSVTRFFLGLVIPAISLMVAYVILERDHFDMHNRGAAELLKWLEPLAQ